MVLSLMNEPTLTKEEYIAYLETTLIPDLRESGMEATAEDFETAVMLLKAETP